VYRLRVEPLLVHDFTFLDGEGPNDLLAASDGKLYGTSANNGPNSGGGTAWRIDLDGTYTLLHAFSFGDPGFDPAAGLTEGTGGIFYGSTKSTIGTVYSVDGSGSFTTLHAFRGADGARPQYGHVVLSTNGALYGITGEGGAAGDGTVFRLDTDGTLTTLHDFTGDAADGASPATNPILASDGNIYGSAFSGGAAGVGTLYRVDSSDAFTTLHVFTAAEGGLPYASPVLATDGNLYGTCTVGPTHGAGTVYRMTTSGTLTTVHEFTGTEGMYPQTRLLASADGMLYGTASYGGVTNTGIVYRLDLAGAAPSFSSLDPLSGRSAGGDVLTLTGDHLRSGATVAFTPIAPFLAVVPAHAHRVSDAFTDFAVTPPLPPGTLSDITITNADGQSATLPSAFFSDFLDSPGDGAFHEEIEAIFRAGIAVGCAAGLYCRDAPATRAQMAVLLLKGEHGSGYTPAPCSGVFADVDCPSLFAAWIEAFAAEGISAGCGGGNYCPDDPVRRDQMAVFLLKVEHGAGYVPPACTPPGTFGDVPCPGKFADWVEQLVAEKITSGCGGGNYCPNNDSTRGQMAVFIVKAFNLQ
jgi:uncharacterized repeat protein (TIGR03803 family)